jgi:paraquat-inducible protein A
MAAFPVAKQRGRWYMTARGGVPAGGRLWHPLASMRNATPPIAETSRAHGLWRCRGCGATCLAAPQAERVRCARCHAVVRERKADSVARTWALLLAATALYIPANLLPVTDTTSIAGTQVDTIFSGIVYLWVEGSRSLAIIVFIASILVPMAKLLVLSGLLVSVQLGSAHRTMPRAQAYRMLEIIGRWSMLDIYVVTVLAALVQVESLAELRPGPGAMAFGAVVVLTMLATRSFDPRLIWDSAEMGAQG